MKNKFIFWPQPGVLKQAKVQYVCILHPAGTSRRQTPSHNTYYIFSVHVSKFNIKVEQIQKPELLFTSVGQI